MLTPSCDKIYLAQYSATVSRSTKPVYSRLMTILQLIDFFFVYLQLCNTVSTLALKNDILSYTDTTLVATTSISATAFAFTYTRVTLIAYRFTFTLWPTRRTVHT